jgi:glycosyl transferase family 25
MLKEHCFTQVINLRRSTERLRLASETLNRVGVAFSRHDAVDGEDLDENQIELYSPRAAKRYFGRTLTRGELGCYLSHRAALGEFIASGSQFGLILEDDIVVSDDFAKIVSQLVAISANWTGAANLGSVDVRVRTSVLEFEHASERRCLCQTPKFPTIATAILWTKSEAQEFLTADRLINAPLDHAYQRWFTKRGKGFAVLPPIATQSKIDTDIGDRAQSRKTISGRISYHWAKTRRDLLLALHSRK